MLKKETLLLLVEKQKKLDLRIQSDLNIDYQKDAVEIKKIIAFFVEFGEFINEERSFKYWSRKKTNDRSKVLEEYIDGVHFILSIGIDMNYNFNNFKFIKLDDSKDLYDLYLEVINSISDLIRYRTIDNFESLLNNFFNISKVLNFSEKEIIDTYNFKNDKNHTRQDNNY